MTDSSRLKSTIFVGGLPPNATSQILHATFIPFGDIVDVSIPKPDKTRRREGNNRQFPDQPSDPSGEEQELNRGFGYVEFESAADAREAIDNMDQSELYGRVIRVAEAKPQKDGTAIGAGTGEGLGSRTALWLQEGYLAANAVDQEDRLAAMQAQERDATADNDSLGNEASPPEDPMQGLEGLDVAGPKDA